MVPQLQKWFIHFFYGLAPFLILVPGAGGGLRAGAEVEAGVAAAAAAAAAARGSCNFIRDGPAGL